MFFLYVEICADKKPNAEAFTNIILCAERCLRTINMYKIFAQTLSLVRHENQILHYNKTLSIVILSNKFFNCKHFMKTFDKIYWSR
jgi:hypothetical protein